MRYYSASKKRFFELAELNDLHLRNAEKKLAAGCDEVNTAEVLAGLRAEIERRNASAEGDRQGQDQRLPG